MLAKSNQALRQSIFSTERVFQIISKPFQKEIESSSSIKLNFKKSIKLKNISYAYSSSKLILQKVNLNMRGKVVGLFGESGSGKVLL